MKNKIGKLEKLDERLLKVQNYNDVNLKERHYVDGAYSYATIKNKGLEYAIGFKLRFDEKNKTFQVSELDYIFYKGNKQTQEQLKQFILNHGDELEEKITELIKKKLGLRFVIKGYTTIKEREEATKKNYEEKRKIESMKEYNLELFKDDLNWTDKL